MRSMNRKEFLGVVTRGAVAFGATALPWARLRAESPGPVMATLSAYMAAAAARTLPAGGRGGDQAPHPGYVRRDDLRIGTAARPGGHRARACSCGRHHGNRCGLTRPLRSARRGARQRRAWRTPTKRTIRTAPRNRIRVRLSCRRRWRPPSSSAPTAPRFIRAVALGYDIGPRVTMALGGVRFRTESHRSTHSIAGTFGASAAAGCVARLNAQQMRWLLDYAAQQASGFAAWERDTDHIEKGFVFAGMPARNGVTAALVVSLKLERRRRRVLGRRQLLRGDVAGRPIPRRSSSGWASGTR